MHVHINDTTVTGAHIRFFFFLVLLSFQTSCVNLKIIVVYETAEYRTMCQKHKLCCEIELKAVACGCRLCGFIDVGKRLNMHDAKCCVIIVFFGYRLSVSSSDRRTMSLERKWKRIIISEIETWNS